MGGGNVMTAPSPAPVTPASPPQSAKPAAAKTTPKPRSRGVVAGSVAATLGLGVVLLGVLVGWPWAIGGLAVAGGVGGAAAVTARAKARKNPPARRPSPARPSSRAGSPRQAGAGPHLPTLHLPTSRAGAPGGSRPASSGGPSGGARSASGPRSTGGPARPPGARPGSSSQVGPRPAGSGGSSRAAGHPSRTAALRSKLPGGKTSAAKSATPSSGASGSAAGGKPPTSGTGRRGMSSFGRRSSAGASGSGRSAGGGRPPVGRGAAGPSRRAAAAGGGSGSSSGSPSRGRGLMSRVRGGTSPAKAGGGAGRSAGSGPTSRVPSAGTGASPRTGSTARKPSASTPADRTRTPSTATGSTSTAPAPRRFGVFPRRAPSPTFPAGKVPHARPGGPPAPGAAARATTPAPAAKPTPRTRRTPTSAAAPTPPDRVVPKPAKTPVGRVARRAAAGAANTGRSATWLAREARAPRKRDPEEERKATRAAWQDTNGGRGQIPTAYSRKTPPPAAERVRPPTHHERSLRDVTPPRLGAKPWTADQWQKAADELSQPKDHDAHPAVWGILDRQRSNAGMWAQMRADGERAREAARAEALQQSAQADQARAAWQDRMDRSQPKGAPMYEGLSRSERNKAISGDERRFSDMLKADQEDYGKADDARSGKSGQAAQDPTKGGGAQPRRAQGGTGRGSGGGGIDSMKSDFHPRLHRAGSAIEQAIAELKAAAADVDDSPSAQPVKDAMNAVAEQLQRPLDQIGEVGSISRQADAPYWDLAEGSRPNKGAWTKD